MFHSKYGWIEGVGQGAVYGGGGCLQVGLRCIKCNPTYAEGIN